MAEPLSDKEKYDDLSKLTSHILLEDVKVTDVEKVGRRVRDAAQALNMPISRTREVMGRMLEHFKEVHGEYHHDCVIAAMEGHPSPPPPQKSESTTSA